MAMPAARSMSPLTAGPSPQSRPVTSAIDGSGAGDVVGEPGAGDEPGPPQAVRRAASNSALAVVDGQPPWMRGCLAEKR